MKLDILAFAAHPDDTELSCAGTLAKHIKQGKKAGVVDLTQGEMGTRGTPEIRAEEAANSAQILGLSARENLKLPDGFFRNDPISQMEVIQKIRKYRPDIILANAVTDRHPDHGRGAVLVKEAAFLSGLKQIKTHNDMGEAQEAWRPRVVYHYIQSQHIQPDLVVDVSDVWEQKLEAIKAFQSQFFTGKQNDNEGPKTFISTPEFMEFIVGRAREYGQMIGVKYAEGFTVNRYIGVDDLTTLL